LIGGVEFMKKDAVPFACAESVTTVEKVDLFFHLFGLFNVPLLFVFLLVVNVLWPLSSGTWETATVAIPPLNVAIGIPVLSSSLVNSPVGSLSTRFVIIGAILAPLAYFLPDLKDRPVETLRYISAGFTSFCTMLIPATITLVNVVLSGRYEFRATGNPLEDALWIRGRSNLPRNLYVGRALSIGIESCAAVFFISIALCTYNLFLLSVSLGMLCGPLFEFLDWDNRKVVWLRHLPFALLALQLIFLTFPAFGYSGLAPNLLMIHF